MVTITNNRDNPFGFYGEKGYGSGKHGPSDFLSSEKFGGLLEIVNKLSYLYFYPRFSEEGHISCFYGNLIFRKIDGTYSWYVDPSYSNYGINLPYDSSIPSEYNMPFDQTSLLWKIPLIDDLVFEKFDPSVKIGLKLNNQSFNMFKAQLSSFDYTTGKIVNFYLHNVFDGTTFSVLDYSSLSDRDIEFYIYGVRVIPRSVL